MSVEVENRLLQSNYTALQSSAKTLSSRYAQLQKAYRRLADQHKSMQSAKSSHQSEVKKLSLQIGEYQAAIADKDRTIAALQLKFQQKIEENQIFADQIAHLDLTIKQFDLAKVLLFICYFY